MKSRRNPRMIAFVSLMLVMLCLINFYIGWHGALFIRTVAPSAPLGLYWPIFALVSFGYLLGRIPSPLRLKPIGRLLKVLGSYYIGLLEVSVLALPVLDLAAWIARENGADRDSFIIIGGSLLLALFAAFLVWGSRNAWSTVVRTYPVAIAKRAGSLVRLRIAAASDLHLGNVVGNRHLNKMVNQINAMEPDLILLPGDVLDDSIEPFIRNDMASTLGRLQAKYGVYAVLGNHEYYGGNIEEYVERMAAIGIRVLRDETVSIEDSFVIAGRKDKTAEQLDPAGRLAIAELLADADKAKPIIVMDHQPQRFDLAAAAGADLLLCGHTHRGQFAPNHWLTKRLFELDWGYLRKESLHAVVSSGYGTWGPPLRIASRSEIVQVDIAFNR